MDEKATGLFIAEIRKQKNMTQRELAESIGVSDKTISKWETGKSLPDLAYIRNLSNALDVTVNELLAGQRFPKSDYSRKAEETIMSLMKENENHRTKNYIASIIGIIFILITIVLLFILTQNGLLGLKIYPGMFIDPASLLFVILPALGIVFLSKKRDCLGILKLLEKILIPIGLISSLSNAIILMGIRIEPDKIVPNLVVCVLSLFYAVVAKVIVVLLIARKEN